MSRCGGPWSVAIAGCGPCGLAAALMLARDGHRVTLFERFDRPAPVGSGLMIQPVGLAVLDSLGLGNRIRREGARIDRLFGKAGQRTVLDVRYSWLREPGLHGVGIHRASLFATLFDAAAVEGVAIEIGREIVASHRRRDGRVLAFADGDESPSFDLVVDALGARSPLSSAAPTLAFGALWTTVRWPEGAHLDMTALEQRYHRSNRMIGLLPVGRGDGDHDRAALFWSLRVDALADWRARGITAWRDEALALWPECAPALEQIADADALTFARYAHRTHAAPVEDALIHLGDSWHSTSPQLGQGANLALLDAFALAKALRETRSVGQALAETVRLRRQQIELYQALSRLFTPVYQSDSRVLPVLRDMLVGPLSKIWPATAIQAAMVGGLIGRPLEPLELCL